VAACLTNCACNVLWRGSVSYVCCVYSVVVLQRVICMVRVLCGGVAA